MRILIEILIFFILAAVFGWDNYLLIVLLVFVLINLFWKRK